ncbi:MAG: hypothetical protein HFE63_00135 [Clostridiales bacterium]|nr:hypothetical protein [Clostridiales bacterium]
MRLYIASLTKSPVVSSGTHNGFAHSQLLWFKNTNSYPPKLASGYTYSGSVSIGSVVLPEFIEVSGGGYQLGCKKRAAPITTA